MVPDRSEASRPRSRPQWLWLCLIVIVGAAGFSGWYWHQQERPGRVEELRGVEAAAAGHFAIAEQDWETGIQKDPTFPGCYQRLGDLYLALHDYPDAVTNYTQASRLQPQNGSIFKQLALAQIANGNNQAAFPAAKRAYELLPQDANAAAAYGALADQQLDVGDAYPALKRAHQLAPNDLHVTLNLAKTEMDMLNMNAAEKHLASYLRTLPNDPLACYLMAVIYNQKPRTPANLHTALMYAQRAYTSGQYPDNLYTLLGQLELDAGQPAAAKSICLQGLQKEPTDRQLLNILIACNARQGHMAQAAQLSARLQTLMLQQNQIDHLQHVVKFNPANLSAGLQLAALEDAIGDPQAAEQDYALMIRKAPQNMIIRRAAAAFLRRTNRPMMAQQVMNLHFVP